MTRKITDKTVDEEIVARFISRDYIHWDRMMRTVNECYQYNTSFYWNIEKGRYDQLEEMVGKIKYTW